MSGSFNHSDLKSNSLTFERGTRVFRTDESDVMAEREARLKKQVQTHRGPVKQLQVVLKTEGNMNDSLDDSIKENPFVVDNLKTEEFVLNACSPDITSRKETMRSFEEEETQKRDCRLIEETLVVGVPEEVKANLRTFPETGGVTFKPRLLYSYPEDERR